MFLDMLRATCHVLRMARTSTVGSMTPHKALGFVESWEQAMRIVNLANSHKVGDLCCLLRDARTVQQECREGRHLPCTMEHRCTIMTG